MLQLMGKRIFQNLFTLATIKVSWFACCVLALIAELDGTNALMFHVEQFDNRPWQYRLRAAGSAWSAEIGESSAESVTVVLPSSRSAVEGQWRWAGEEQWQDAVAHQFLPNAECLFHVRSEAPFRQLIGEFRVCAAVRGHPSVWSLMMPDRMIAEHGPETVTVTGYPLCLGLGQILREEGEFQCKGGGFTVMNAAKSQAALLPVPVAVPGELPFRGLFLVKTGRLTDEEIELLKHEASPPWQT
jgi:hypothetical protein